MYLHFIHIISFIVSLLLVDVNAYSMEFDMIIVQYEFEVNKISSHIKQKKTNEIAAIIKQLKITDLDLTILPSNLYKIDLFLGSPPQAFSVAIDTGSFVSWVASNQCSSCENVFNPNSSSTYKSLNKKS